jgi:murein DD-endopeptidase / murein LD-carboxypeptidase
MGGIVMLTNNYLMKISRLLLLMALCLSWSCRTNHKAVASHIKKIDEKYSRLLEVKKESLTNKKLYSFIENWYGIHYQYGGKNKNGIDCSGFVQILFKEVYGKIVSGSTKDIYSQCTHVLQNQLREGDLVFFKIDSRDVSHVGIYLQNDKFVHASTKAGVMIDCLNEEYYKKYFAGGGLLKGGGPQ